MSDVAIIGPVGIRPHNLEGECHANQGHKHNYDHVTLLQYGAVDAICTKQVRRSKDEPKRDVPTGESYELRPQPISGESNDFYKCGGIWLRRVNVLPGNVGDITISRSSTFIQLQGESKVRCYRGDLTLFDGPVPAGEHLYLNSDIRVEIVSCKPSQAMLMFPVLPTDEMLSPVEQTIHGGDFCFIAANKRHLIKSRSKYARYLCTFPHRGFDGVPVETYEASMGNQAAYV